MTQIIKTRLQLRRFTAAEWTAANEVLLDQEPGIETDTATADGKYKFKIGDGVTHWNDLPYFQAGGGVETIVAGSGVAVDSTDPKNPIVSSTLGSIALSGRVTDYASLPSTLGSGDDGKAYLSDEDGLIYTWNGSAFQAKGAGTNGAGNILARDPYAAYVTSLKRFKPGVPLIFDDVNGPWGNHNSSVAPMTSRGMETTGDKGIYSPANGAYIVPLGSLATIDIWFIADDNTVGNLATTRPTTDGYGWLLRREANGALIIADIGGASFTTSTGVVPPGVFHFVRMRYTATKCELYVNGVLKGSFTRTVYNYRLTDPVTLGYSVRTGSTNPLNGAIKSFRFTQGYARDGAEVPGVFF